ncbi:hypothetical protein D3C77_564090 [compost metagenome]
MANIVSGNVCNVLLDSCELVTVIYTGVKARLSGSFAERINDFQRSIRIEAQAVSFDPIQQCNAILQHFKSGIKRISGLRRGFDHYDGGAGGAETRINGQAADLLPWG